ncbi:MAG: hypothetical protein QOE19_2504, partial [Actinomycetota bacterium]|nr:hypothetical protein [Actinomycetota bacterium]
YLDAWLIGIRPTLAVAGWTNYRSVINLYVRPRIGNQQMQALTAQLLTALYGELHRRRDERQAAVAHHGPARAPRREQGARGCRRVADPGYQPDPARQGPSVSNR